MGGLRRWSSWIGGCRLVVRSRLEGPAGRGLVGRGTLGRGSRASGRFIPPGLLGPPGLLSPHGLPNPRRPLNLLRLLSPRDLLRCRGLLSLRRLLSLRGLFSSRGLPNPRRGLNPRELLSPQARSKPQELFDAPELLPPPERLSLAGQAKHSGRTMALSLPGLVGLTGVMGLAGWLGTGGGGDWARAMEAPIPKTTPREPVLQTTEPGNTRFREVEVSDLGSNNALPEALRAVFFPLPLEFAERAPAGERLMTRRPGGGEGGDVGVKGEGMPSLGYPINQAPIEVSAFGMRWSDARAAWKMHTGIDLIVTEGTPVLAAAAGRVLLVDEVSGYGLTVLVDHGQGWQTLYAHLFEIAVQPGDQVQRGQPLGRVGDSGRASTPHLHFEIRQRRGDRLVALDPAPLLRPREPGAIVRRP